MSIIFKHIINVFLFLCIVKSSFLYSQTYNPQTQNRSWSANNSISTVFLKASGVDITITPNLNMIQFVDSNGDTYGYDGDNDIPTNWTYEILDGNDDVPADTSVSADKKTIIFTADPDEDIDIYLKVIDNNGNIIDNLSRVQLRLYIRGNLTVASAQWNACEQAYLLSVNEQTRDGVKLCAPYRVIVYELKSGSIDTSNVIYDSNNDSGHNVNSNSFTLNLGVGNYAAIITNSCNEQVNSSGDGYYYFSVTEAYSIGASSIFSGYQCVGDGFGTTVIKLEGAAKPITWQLKNSNGQVILTHNNTSQYSYQNYNEQFDTQNFTVTIPNLSTGTYTFTFTDGNACSEDLTFKIQRPEEIKASVIQNDSKLQLACYGDSDGEITFLASGGWTEPWDGNYVNPNGWGDPYTFSLTKDGKTFSSGDVLRHFVNGNQVGYKTSFTGLSAGSYSLIVRENVATNPYNSNTIYNCAKVFQQTFTISEPDEFTSSGSVTDIDCNGNESGAIDLSVDGGTANYIYAWTKTGDDSYSATTQDLTDLSAGTYNVTITDASDCTTTNSFTIVEPTELIIADAGLSTEIACFGDNGQIRVDITQESVPVTEDSTPDYTYDLYQGDSVVQTTTTSDLNYTFDAPAGTYKVRVTDASGCFKETTDITLTQPDPISISTNNTSNVSCNGGSDGLIDITISGGTTNNSSSYTIQWIKENDSNFSANSEEISNLSSGTYTVTITDSNDCSISDTFTISEPDELTSSGSITNIDCNGNDNGAIDLSIDGGTANYIYAWTKTGDDSYSATTQDLTDLSAGTYNVTITDANDCTTTNSFTIIEPVELIIADAGLSTEIACFGDNGLIRVNITQATVASYTYALYQGDSVVQTTTISDLNYTFSAPAGTYEVRVTDANGCASSFTTELTQAEEELLIDIEKTDLNCYNSNNGTITVTTTGGVAPYTFSWSDSGTGNFRDGLTIGTYTVTITDSIGCVKVRTVEIENGDLFNIDPVVTPISCFGADDGSIELNLEGGVSPISFIWSDDSNAGQSRNNLPPGDYSVLIQDASGCEIQRDFTIIEPEEISIAAVVTNATDCDNPASGSIDLQISGGNSPYIFQWSNGAVTEDISALIAQTYSVTVTDSKGCISEKEFTITRPDDLEIDLATNIYAVCESREVFQNNTLSISGGVAPYIIQWSGGEVTGNNNEIMDTKIDGSYQVTVTDALGCSESISFDVSTPEIGFPDFTYDSFYLSNYDALSTKDPIDFTNLSTEDFFSVYWDFGDGNYSEEVDAQHTYDKKGTYQVTLTVEFILGCSYSITKTIYIGDSFEIVIPNAFTPNNDGYNDNFRAVYYGFKYLKMQIFDTWGTLIYSEESRTDELIGWNGRIGSKDGENGNYFYQVSGNSFTDVKFAKNGSFTLIR